MVVADVLHVFLLGLLGAGHCVGMCGVFAVGVATGERRAGPLLVRQAAYQVGKASAYLLVGAALLALGRWIDASNPVLRMQEVLGLGVGAALVLWGVSYVVEWRWPAGVARWWQGSAVCGLAASLWRAPSLGRSVLVGWLNGFLPCGLSLMAILYLVGTNSVTTLVVGVYAFGLGTMPALAAVAWAGQRWSVSRRRVFMRLAGVALIALGVLTMVRGSEAVHGWMHWHLVPTMGAEGHAGH